jgi:hypothetical protein
MFPLIRENLCLVVGSMGGEFLVSSSAVTVSFKQAFFGPRISNISWLATASDWLSRPDAVCIFFWPRAIRATHIGLA